MLAAGWSGADPSRSSPRNGAASRNAASTRSASPIEIDGVWYYPAEGNCYGETGIAGPGANGAGQIPRARHGERRGLRPNSLTAAHRTLPMPSHRAGHQPRERPHDAVRVNDRGPFARGRIIDLSRRAASSSASSSRERRRSASEIMTAESIQIATIARQNGTETGRARPRRRPRPRRAEAVVARRCRRPGVAAAPPPAPPGAARRGTAERDHLHAQARAGRAVPPGAAHVSALAHRAARGAAAEPPPLSDNVSVVPIAPTQIWIQAGAFATRKIFPARRRGSPPSDPSGSPRRASAA